MKKNSVTHPSEYVVVLTACINPGACNNQIVRTDVTTRLQDYAEGLQFWLNLKDERITRIVFIDNSGYSLDSLREIVRTSNPWGKTVEFLSMALQDYPEGVHYGYGELAMLDEVAAKSQLFNSSRYFIKCTGRLTFPKLPKLLNKMADNTLFSVDCRRNSLFRSQPQSFVTTQLMIFSTSFYQSNLKGLKAKMFGDTNGIETLYYRELSRFEGKDGAILRWPVSVDPVGYAAHAIGANGTQAKNYGSPKQRTINLSRSLTRTFIPSWWM